MTNEECKQALTRIAGYMCARKDIEALTHAMNLLEQKPILGQWLSHSIDGRYRSIDKDICSICGRQIEQDHGYQWNFCPNCGADMRDYKASACKLARVKPELKPS